LSILNKNQIEPKHVELAFMDYAEILEHTYSFIDNKILGSLDYGENWAGAVKKDQDILKWLHEKGATSMNTSTVSIKDYKEKIMDLYNVKEKQAGRHKTRHEESGWIKSKKGQHDSKVWLAFEHEKESSSDVRGDRVDMEFKDKYMEIIKKYNAEIVINDGIVEKRVDYPVWYNEKSSDIKINNIEINIR